MNLPYNYDHTDISTVADRIKGAHPYMFNYYKKKFLKRSGDGIYWIPVIANKDFLALLTDKEKEYWGERVGPLKKELKMHYTNPINADLITFSNGAFDISTLSFRRYMDGDFVSESIDYDYKPADPVKKQWMMDLLQSIFDPAELTTVLKTISQGLVGKPQILLFYGGQGKGLLLTIIRCTLEHHCGFLRSKSDADCLILIGNDEERDVRFCKKYGAQCTTIIDSYEFHQINNCIAIKFPYKFVDNPVQPNERRINRLLKQEVKNYANEFFEILVDHYKM